MNIEVNYGELDGNALPSSAIGESTTSIEDFSYSEIKNALAKVDPQAATSLPATTPIDGSLWLGTAQAASLGLADPRSVDDAANNPAIDGSIAFNNSLTFTYDPNNRAVPGAYDFAGTAEHEITEALGRFD
ncbi:MAG TPA: hypothetical protein VKV32_14300, partial [Stellaceae bacterium]|nr:hypothetical protein [Stellaceae bacterium]